MMRNIYIDDAIERGHRLGLQEGLQQGMRKGIARGRKEGREEGLSEGLRKTVIRGYKNQVPLSMIAVSVGKTQAQVKEIIRSELGPDACEE